MNTAYVAPFNDCIEECALLKYEDAFTFSALLSALLDAPIPGSVLVYPTLFGVK